VTTGEEMQKIALEMNFSETTFVMSGGSPEKGYDVRIFLPHTETPFAGHPTLGSAFVIRKEIDPGPDEEVVLNLGIGKVPVRFESRSEGTEILWMSPPTPTFGATHPAESVAPMLGIPDEDIDDRFPVEEVSIGIPFVFVPVKNLDVLRNCSLDLRGRPDFMLDGRDLTCVFVFCPEVHEPGNHVAARMFFESNGVREDPATGSANTCFAAYLLKHQYLGTGDVDARVEQGYEMGRPSLLYLRASGDPDAPEVSVGGRVILVARGELV